MVQLIVARPQYEREREKKKRYLSKNHLTLLSFAVQILIFSTSTYSLEDYWDNWYGTRYSN
jgi:hypothetical protein